MAKDKVLSVDIACDISVYREIPVYIQDSMNDQEIRQQVEFEARRIMSDPGQLDSGQWKGRTKSVCCRRIIGVHDYLGERVMNGLPLETNTAEIGVAACGIADEFAKGLITKEEFADRVLLSISDFGHEMQSPTEPVDDDPAPGM
jgi:hypothetical protein